MSVVNLDSVTMSLDQDRVLLIKFKEVAVDIEETRKIMNRSAEMVNKKGFRVLIDARDVYASVDHNSRKYMAEHEVNEYNIAQAMVVNNIPVRIIANFYLKFYKHSYPMKVFKNIDSAREWLMQQG